MSTLDKTSDNKIINKRSKDPFDRLIFEKGLRATEIMVNKKLRTMVVLLNNGIVIKVPIDLYNGLKNATQEQLNKWELISGGVGIHWKSLNEDLSLKGLIKESVMASALNRLEGKTKGEMSIF